MKKAKTTTPKTKNKLAILVKKLRECILKDRELDAMTVIELEAMGFKVYPPTSYPER
jgi:hypothetical protein